MMNGKLNGEKKEARNIKNVPPVPLGDGNDTRDARRRKICFNFSLFFFSPGKFFVFRVGKGEKK
jgi:hypothetical protein